MSEGTYTYDYPRPMLTVDAVVFAVRDGGLNVLLIQRGQEPWKGMWAIPGGFIDMDEELDAAARRELEEETGVTGVPLVQYHTFGGVGRDPRGRVITVAYLGVADPDRVEPKGGDDATHAAWKPMPDLPAMAADHRDVIARAVEALDALLRDEAEAARIVPPSVALEILRSAVSVARDEPRDPAPVK